MSQSIEAEILLPCSDIHETLPFYTDKLGFRLDTIYPADDPAVAKLSGHGLRLRLQRGLDAAPGVLRLNRDGPIERLTAPNGTQIEIAPSDIPLDIPDAVPELVVTKVDDSAWHMGRAGMRYRDLIPSRWGGRFIASHIRLIDGGPIPDYVHYHQVRFQMIYCRKGWFRVLYEDQGEPFVMTAGDCVLQPPEIRHRVLECPAGAEVVEIGCPAEHPTHAEHAFDLPKGVEHPHRDFNGQKFIWHQADRANWYPWRQEGFEARDIGIGNATEGLAGVQVLRPKGGQKIVGSYEGEFMFLFILSGQLSLISENLSTRISSDDAVALPPGLDFELTDISDDTEILEVVLPAL